MAGAVLACITLKKNDIISTSVKKDQFDMIR